MAKSEATQVKYIYICPDSQRMARHLKKYRAGQIKALVKDAHAHPAVADDGDEIAPESLIADALSISLRALAESELATLIGRRGRPIGRLFAGCAVAAWDALDEINFGAIAQIYLLGVNLDRDSEQRFAAGVE